MREIDRIIRRTRLRLTLADFIDRSGRWLLAGITVSLALILMDRLAAVAVPTAGLLLAPIAGSLMSALLAWRHRPGVVSAAARLDHELGLKDRIGSAAALDDSIPWVEPFADLVRRDAEAMAPLARARLKEATGLRWTQSWLGAAGLLAITTCTWFLLPEMDLFPREGFSADERERIARAETQAEVALREAAEALRQSEGDEPDPISGRGVEGDESTAEVLKTLDRLSEQLAATDESTSAPDPRRADEALAEAANEIASLSESMEERANAAEKADRLLADQLAMIEPQEGGSADELTDALQKADFERAAQEVQGLKEQMDSLSNEEREALARQLRDLSEQIESAPTDAIEQRQQEVEADRETLIDQGVDPEEAQRLASEEFQPDDVARALEDAGVDKQTAEDLAEEIVDRERRRSEQEQFEERLRDTARDFEELGEAIDPNAPDSPTTTPTDGPEQPRTDEHTDSPDPGGQPDPTGESDPAGEPKPVPTEEPGETGPIIGDPPGDGPKTEDPPPSDPSTGPARGDPPPIEEGNPPTEGPGSETDPTIPPVTGPTPPGGETAREGDPPDGPQGEPSPSQPTTSPPNGSGNAPGSEPGTEPAVPRSADEIIDHLTRNLDEIERQRERIARDRAAAERMRQEAEKLLEQLSPEEREKLERWASEYAREQQRNELEGDDATDSDEDVAGNQRGPRAETNNKPFDIEDVQTQRPEDEAQDDQVIAEWFSDEPHGPDDRISRNLPPGERTRRAADAMERALNEEAIAPRYRTLIRNWARRLREQQLIKAGGASASKDPEAASGSVDQ